MHVTRKTAVTSRAPQKYTGVSGPSITNNHSSPNARKVLKNGLAVSDPYYPYKRALVSGCWGGASNQPTNTSYSKSDQLSYFGPNTW